jgi:hypothetical protein
MTTQTVEAHPNLIRAIDADLFVVPGTLYPTHVEYLCEDIAGYASSCRDWAVGIYHDGKIECECDGPDCVHIFSVKLYLERIAHPTETEDRFLARLEEETCAVTGCYNPAIEPGGECATHIADYANWQASQRREKLSA